MPPPQSDSAVSVQKVTIGVCTFRRPSQLADLLRSISALDVADDIALSILVVDNDATPTALPTVDAAKVDFPWPIRHVHEPSPGISTARNRVLAEAGSLGFLAFVDDDETVSPSWLMALVAAQRAKTATFIQGPVAMSVADPLDEWWLSSAFFLQNTYENYAPLGESWTNNVLIDLGFVHTHGLTFDVSLQFEGGEDTLFFHDIIALGGTGYFINDAVVHEVQPPSRLSWKWGIARQYRYGITRAKVAKLRKSGPRALSYCIVRGTGMLVIGIAKLPSAIVSGRIGVAAGVALLSRGVGVFAGYLGKGHEAYGGTN